MQGCHVQEVRENDVGGMWSTRRSGDAGRSGVQSLQGARLRSEVTGIVLPHVLQEVDRGPQPWSCQGCDPSRRSSWSRPSRRADRPDRAYAGPHRSERTAPTRSGATPRPHSPSPASGGSVAGKSMSRRHTRVGHRHSQPSGGQSRVVTIDVCDPGVAFAAAGCGRGCSISFSRSRTYRRRCSDRPRPRPRSTIGDGEDRPTPR